jgi:arylsulfatase A-like enzyme
MLILKPLLISLMLFACCEARAAEPLNFVFILIDDLGQRDLGCYGSTFYETPHVDALAASGVRFTSAYAACPVCSPTRASIQSGKYPARLRTTDFFGGPQPEEAAARPRYNYRKLLPAAYLERLPLEEVTIAERLRDAGYATFFTGKWHLGHQGYWPEDQGYDINVGGNHAGHPKTYFSPYNNPKLPDGPDGEQLDERLARETARFILDHRDEPFFAFFSQFDVHLPLQTKPELEQKYAAKAKQVVHDGPRFKPDKGSDVRQVQDHPVYGGMVESMDDSVGIVLDALESAGVADRTAVIFMSDNGGLSTKEGSPTSNEPLRCGKGWMYEGGIRVPMIVRWPGVTQPGAVCDQYVTSVDFYPTMLEMAGLPPQEAIDGVSFAPLLRGEDGFERGPVYWHYPHYGNQGGVPARAIRSGAWKLIEFFEDGRRELYNLADDLPEQHDLAADQPDRVKQLHGKLLAWSDEVDAVLPTPNPHVRKQRGAVPGRPKKAARQRNN